MAGLDLAATVRLSEKTLPIRICNNKFESKRTRLRSVGECKNRICMVYGGVSSKCDL